MALTEALQWAAIGIMALAVLAAVQAVGQRRPIRKVCYYHSYRLIPLGFLFRFLQRLTGKTKAHAHTRTHMYITYT